MDDLGGKPTILGNIHIVVLFRRGFYKTSTVHESFVFAPWSKYMAQSPKARLVQGVYKPIHGNCAIYWATLVHHMKYHRSYQAFYDLEFQGLTQMI